MQRSDSEAYFVQVRSMGYCVTREEIKEEYEKIRLRQGMLSCL